MASSEQFLIMFSVFKTKTKIEMYKMYRFILELISIFLTMFTCILSQGHHMFGVMLTFIATRSGLLRWRDHGTNNNKGSEP